MNETRVSEQFTVGWDVGQLRDFSAISIAERVTFVSHELGVDGFEPPATRKRERVELHVVHLQRIRRGVSYVAQLDIVADVFCAIPPANDPPLLALDTTGVGRGLLDHARAHRLLKSRVRPIGITLTGGHTESRPGPGEWHVPRRMFLSNLAIMLQNESLKIAPGLAEAETLATELANVRARASSSAESDESSSSSVHDDLVFSVGCAAYVQQRRPKPFRLIPGGVITLRNAV